MSEWDQKMRKVFTRDYEWIKENPTLFFHPKAAPLAPEHINTIAWNAAWLAAEAAGGVDLKRDFTVHEAA